MTLSLPASRGEGNTSWHTMQWYSWRSSKRTISSANSTGGTESDRQMSVDQDALRVPTSMRAETLSHRLKVGCAHRSRPPVSAGPIANSDKRPPPNASQSSASSSSLPTANMRKPGTVGSVSTTRTGWRHPRIHPASTQARPSRRSTARTSTSPPTYEIDPHLKPVGTLLRLPAGTSNASGVSSVRSPAVLLLVLWNDAAKRSSTRPHDLHHVRHHTLNSRRHNPSNLQKPVFHY